MSSFEVQSLCKREIRRWIWLMAALFATITLIQYAQVLNVDLSFSSSSKAANTQQQQQQPLPPPQQEQRKPDNHSTGVNTSHAQANQRFPGLLNTGRIEAGLALNNNISSTSEEGGGIAPLEGSLDGDDEDDLDLGEANNGTSVLLESTSRREQHSLVNDTRIEDDRHDEPSPPIMPILEPNSTLSSSAPNNMIVPPPPSPSASPPPPSPSPPPPTQKHRISPLKPLAKEVYSLRDMDELLTEGRRSAQSSVPLWSTKADRELKYVKYEIENAHPPPKAAGLQGPLYRNVTQFYRSYELMEKMLKVYVYKEGDRPVFHNPNLQGIYSSEGWFMKHMESSRGHFHTKDPNRAHLFYLPFSSQMLVTALYVPNSHSRDNLVQHLKNFLDTVVARYPFWNRTGGADHFLVSCHDWAPAETRLIMSPCIRALCNADVKVGFDFGKDVSLPETNIPNMKNPLRNLGGKSPSKRKTLAFFAGQMHGYLRPVLLQHWENVDPAMKIYGKLPLVKGNRNYVSYMQDSKYCICPRGYEVNSPRVVEAIFYECVPVIISDNFIPPLFETLNWESFAVFVQEKDVPRLKEILLAIPERTYLRLLMRVKMVQRHFLWHPKRPEKYDLFHMILHSVWYNRVFQFRPI